MSVPLPASVPAPLPPGQLEQLLFGNHLSQQRADAMYKHVLQQMEAQQVTVDHTTSGLPITQTYSVPDVTALRKQLEAIAAQRNAQLAKPFGAGYGAEELHYLYNMLFPVQYPRP